MTPQEFAASIKAKYPQYASIDDNELTQRILTKYPQYQGAVQADVAAGARANLAKIQSGGDIPQGALNPDQPSFASGVKDMLLPSISGQNMKDVVTGTFVPGALPLVAAKNAIQMGAGLLRNQYGEAQKAKDAYTGGDLTGGIRHSVLAGTPVVGPLAGQIGEEIGQGNISHGLGMLTGLGANVVAPELAAKGTGAIARAIAPERAAQVEQYAKVLDPRLKHPELANDIAGRLLDEGVVLKNPRTDLANIAESKASAVDTTTPILNRAQAARTGPILQEIKNQRAQLFNEVKRFTEPADPKLGAQLQKKLGDLYPMAEITKDGGELVVNQIRHPSMWDKANELNKLAKHIKDSASRGMIANDTLRNLTQDYNYYADKGGAFTGAETNPVRLPADAHVAGALQDVVNQDPAAAAANAEKSTWLQAKNDLAPSAQIAKTGGGGTLKRLLIKSLGAGAATAAGALFGGPVGAQVVGGTMSTFLSLGELRTFARTVMTSPQWNTWSAVNKMKFAKVLASGNAEAAAEIAARANQGATATEQDSGVKMSPMGETMRRMGILP